jgi:hypothetical protein
MRAIPRLNAHFILIPAALLAMACKTESVESTDVKTTGIYPEIEVTADGSGDSEVRVWLKVGGDDSNTFLQLTGKDTLEVTVDGDTKTMDKSGDENDPYRATFGVDAEGTEFSIAFLRGGEDDDAPASTVLMPAPFDLTVPDGEFSRASDDIEYSWDPPGDGNLSWHTNGTCIKTGSGSTPDDGTNTLAAGDIETFDSDKEETCTVNLEVSRAQTGDIDSAFTEGGDIVAKHIRGGSFTSAP